MTTTKFEPEAGDLVHAVDVDSNNPSAVLGMVVRKATMEDKKKFIKLAEDNGLRIDENDLKEFFSTNNHFLVICQEDFVIWHRSVITELVQRTGVIEANE